ncbi:MAG: hypothetical protein WDZ80_01455, partial [Candidatus Paceibacterota bacterium]
GYFTFLILPLAAWLGIIRYYDAAAGYVENTFILRFRNLAKTTTIIKKKCVQAADIQSIYFQRRRYLLNFMVTVASGKSGATFIVNDLDQKTGEDLFTCASSNNYNVELTGDTEKTLPGW